MISVIVPVYNVESVLHYCIDSIINQTYLDFELIIVDDGSTDNSGTICDSYAAKDNRIKVIHQKNSGVSKARNVGIEMAQRDFICFLDSDDYIDPLYLLRLIKLKQQFQDCDNIWCGFQTVDGYIDATILHKAVFSLSEDISKADCKQIMDLHEKWLDAGPVCKLYNRKVIMYNNLRFDESLTLGEDLIFNFEYLDCTDGKIIVNNECLYNYVFMKESTLSSKFYYNMFDIYRKINRIMYNHMKKWDCDNTQFSKYFNACFYKYEVVLQNTFHPDSTISQKYYYNSRILKSQEFIVSLKNCNCYIHPFYRIAYTLGCYRWVRCLDKIFAIIHI